MVSHPRRSGTFSYQVPFSSFGKQLSPNPFLSIDRNKFKFLLRAISSLPLLSYHGYEDTNSPVEKRPISTL